MVRLAVPDPAHQALMRLHKGVLSLPAEFPRPQALISPDSVADLEEWKRHELQRREQLNDCVRHWIDTGAWPEDLDGEGGYLILLRMRCARDWLEVATLLVSLDLTVSELLEELMVRLWAEHFLDRHLETLHSGIVS